MSDNVSEQCIFRATSGLALHASLARTLAYCIFWSQHAMHRDGEYPSIWKTGPELSGELKVAPRTANRHLKELAKLGYWTLSYRPKPGSVGPVSWLTFTSKSLGLLDLAREYEAKRGTGRKTKKVTAGGISLNPPEVIPCDDGMSHGTTSKHHVPTGKTAKGNQSFLLSSEAGKQGMKETVGSKFTGETGKKKKIPKAPGYLNVSDKDHELAAVVKTTWVKAGLKEWDWTSRFTWEHIAEIRVKMAKLGVTEGASGLFMETMLNNWNWLRSSMSYRYSSSPLNLHGPSPMALAHEFEVIGKAVFDKLHPVVASPKSSCLDEDF